MTLIHIIYASAAVDPNYYTDAMLEKLLIISRNNNKKINVTGMLLYCDHSFFQVIEGEEKNIQALFEKIIHDRTHTNIVKITEEPIAYKSFPNWTMGFIKSSKKSLSTIKGMNDFFQKGKCLTEIDQGRAKKILHAFSKGRWRIGASG